MAPAALASVPLEQLAALDETLNARLKLHRSYHDMSGVERRE
jgi:hypothetical protein